MPDPAALLLLTCASCDKTPSLPQIAATTDASCLHPKGEFKGERLEVLSHNCISPPELSHSKNFNETGDVGGGKQDLQLHPLKVSSQGEAVTRLQMKLQQLGYYTAAVDGQYGPMTEAAVSQFQQSKGVNVDGVVGSLTWTQLLPSDTEAQGRRSAGASVRKTLEVQHPLLSIPTRQQLNSPFLLKAGEDSRLLSSISSLSTDSPARSHDKGSQLDLTLASLNAQPQSLWMLGGVVFCIGGVAFLLRLKPFAREELDLKLRLADVLKNFQPANFQPSNSQQLTNAGEFDQPIILQQSRIWLQMIVWGIVSVTSFTIVWACVAQIEEAVPAQGKLEPQGTVDNVQAPVGGVVKTIYVKEGQRVKAGDLLLSFDRTASNAQLKLLRGNRAALVEENDAYRRVLGNDTPTGIKLSSNMALLTQNRTALVAENQLYQLQLQGGTTNELSSEQRQRLQSAQAELNSRVADAELAVPQLEKQLSQNQIAIANARKTLAVKQEVFNGYAQLLKSGAIARVQVLNQQQEVGSQQAEVDRLTQEQARLELEIAQSKQKLRNTISASRQNLLVKVDDNKKRIAEIDSQLAKASMENEKRLAEVDFQIIQTEQTLRYQDLRAAVAGTIFDLKANYPGFVANTSEPILKIVPEDSLVAKVFITNQNIGVIRPGMLVDVRIDAFPYSEFGDVKGELVTIGSDALPPDSFYPFYRFPAKIRLRQQAIAIDDRKVPLRSGMSVSVNIKGRKHTVISIFTSLFTQKIDAIKSVR